MKYCNYYNSVLTLQVSTAILPHDREPCEIKVVSNHTCSLQTCVCTGSRRVRVGLSGLRRQGISSTPGGLLKCPIPVRVCAEQCGKIAGLLRPRSFLNKLRKALEALSETVEPF